MSEVQVKLDGESKPVTDVPVQPVQPVAVKPVQPVAPPPATSTVAPSTETVESPLDDELPQRIEPIQSTGTHYPSSDSHDQGKSPHRENL